MVPLHVHLFLATALAHGPPPHALGVTAADADGPVVVKLTEGAAQRTADGWRFVCPAVWGSVPESPFGRSHDRTARLHGAVDLVHLDADGTVTPQGVPELSLLELVAVASGPDSAWALRRGPAEDALWRVDVPGEVWVAAGDLSSVAVGAQVHVAEVVDGRLDVVTLTADGAEVGRATRDAGPIDYTPGLRLADDVLWLAERRVGDHALIDPDGTIVATSPDEILGPVAGGFVALDRLLHRIADGAVTRTASEDFLTCLEDTPSGPVACVFPDLHRLEPDGTIGERLFAMDDLLPPTMATVPTAAQDDCDFEWRRIAIDLGRELDPPVVPFEPETPDGSGRAGGCGGGRAGALLVLLPFARRRRRPAPGSSLVGAPHRA